MPTPIIPRSLDSEFLILTGEACLPVHLPVSWLGPQLEELSAPWPQARLPGSHPRWADLCPRNSPWSCPDFPVS